jgi:hypothetical protein
MPRGLSLNRAPDQPRRGSSLNRLPNKPTTPVKEIRERIEDLKLEERMKRKSAMTKDAKERERILHQADVIQRMYTQLEEKLARNSPTLYKKKETFATRKLRAEVLKRRKEAEWAASIAAYKAGTYKSKPVKSYHEREEEAEIYKERARARKELKEMAENPQAFEAKMKKKEEEEQDTALSGAFGTFQKDPDKDVDEGLMELLSQPSPAKTMPKKTRKEQSEVPLIMPFKAMSDPGRRIKRSRSKRSRSKRARSANQVSKGRKTPIWAKRKKARPAPVRSRHTRPKSSFFSGRYQ